MKKLLLIFFFLLATVFAYCNNTLPLVERFYDDLYAHLANQGSTNQCFFDYSVSYQQTDDSEAPITNRTKVYRKNSLMYVDSGEIEMWKTETDVFIVFKTDKTINWNKVAVIKDQSQLNNPLEKMVEFQKLMFQHVDSQKEKAMGSGKVELTLDMSSTFRTNFRVSSIRFIYNYSNKKVEQMEMIYCCGHSLKSQTVKYYNIDYNYQSKRFKGRFERNVITQNGTASKNYQGYKIVKLFK